MSLVNILVPRRYFYIACVSLIGISFLGLIRSFHPFEAYPITGAESIQSFSSQSKELWHSSNYLRGPPTDSFRDNLLPDVKYITSWISAGWTNDVMTYINLIYLGVLTNRVPIIPMFTPSHIGGKVPPIDFGEVFDVPRLRRELEKPILEWHEVKNSSTNGDYDEIGCWNTWEAVQNREANPRRSAIPDLLKLDISYTKAPTWIKAIPRYEHDLYSTFSSLASLAFPETRAENMIEPRESPRYSLKLPPDEQMLCYDYLYYVCSHQSFEFDFDYSPAWLFVGQFMHWTPKLETLAEEYVRNALDIEVNLDIPPWIAIHVRHGDFKNLCENTAVHDCFAPISVIARRVDEIKQEILQRKGLTVNHVIMTSDERNVSWWQSVKALGWYALDHSKTAERYGTWYPVLIDAVIQSRSWGFIGTDRSTMSILARRRVQSWQDGVVRTVRWGRPEADNH